MSSACRKASTTSCSSIPWISSILQTPQSLVLLLLFLKEFLSLLEAFFAFFRIPVFTFSSKFPESDFCLCFPSLQQPAQTQWFIRFTTPYIKLNKCEEKRRTKTGNFQYNNTGGKTKCNPQYYITRERERGHYLNSEQQTSTIILLSQQQQLVQNKQKYEYKWLLLLLTRATNPIEGLGHCREK